MVILFSRLRTIRLLYRRVLREMTKRRPEISDEATKGFCHPARGYRSTLVGDFVDASRHM